MLQTVAIGVQRFTEIRENNIFYVDKTGFIKEWWESGDEVTVITRPRRFGKTLTMNMLENFFSTQYAGREDLFAGLDIWKYEEYRKLQGTWPVIGLSFANVKSKAYDLAIRDIRLLIAKLYRRYDYLLDSEALKDYEKEYFLSVCKESKDVVLEQTLNNLSEYIYRDAGKKPIIILDEYDTPMQEAYFKKYWDELSDFMRSFFNSGFKTNPYMHRAIMTGITRVSKESLFSDFNHANILTIFDDQYSQYFGFTEQEVFHALDEYGLGDKDIVKMWYDGFTFGNRKDMYNPWSIIKYISSKKVGLYWTNTSKNELVRDLIGHSTPMVKSDFEMLLNGLEIETRLDDNLNFDQLQNSKIAIMSFLTASGYLRARPIDGDRYAVTITNYETRKMFNDLVPQWFIDDNDSYNSFVLALLRRDLKSMNGYMRDLTKNVISYFDSGKKPSSNEPERFYHGLVLGLLVELRDRYVVKSNRESGYGRYDIMLEPKDVAKDDGIIIEFKVLDLEEESTLQDTANNALKQIKDMNYAANLMERGVPVERIHSYGFAFHGKNVLILGK